jgi:molybdenum cofactor synthesis domain-containing protein
MTISPGVAAIIIGNEVLTAKVTEANGAHLIRRCRERGVRLVSVHVVPDEVDFIVEAVLLARRRAKYVITSGGVGPTHDDVTVRAVSLALGRPVVTLPKMVTILRDAWGETPPPAEALRMAEGPEGAQLIASSDTRFPVLMASDVYMLPGVPELFRSQLETVVARLPGQPVSLRTLYLQARESDLARVLDATAAAMPDVAFGSYPTFDATLDYRVKVTIEHADQARVAAASERLRRDFPAGIIVREDV